MVNDANMEAPTPLLASRQQPSGTPGRAPVIDETALEQVIAGDQELLKELVGIFLQDLPRMLAGIRQAISDQAPDALTRSAHLLKGSVKTFCATAAAEAALRLELMGRERRMVDAQQAYAQLESCIAELQAALARKAA